MYHTVTIKGGKGWKPALAPTKEIVSGESSTLRSRESEFPPTDRDGDTF